MHKPTPKKSTAWLTEQQANNIAAAWFHAEQFCVPLNTAITIHFALIGGPGAGDYRARLYELNKRIYRYLARRGFDAFGVWVLEDDETRKNLHVHMAVHLPEEIPFADFEAFLWRQIATDIPAALKVDEADIGWLRYILKGVEPHLRQQFKIRRKDHKQQGVVYGKRCGVSRSLDQKARMEREIKHGLSHAA